MYIGDMLFWIEIHYGEQARREYIKKLSKIYNKGEIRALKIQQAKKPKLWISSGFTWSNTIQGASFWKKINTSWVKEIDKRETIKEYKRLNIYYERFI